MDAFIELREVLYKIEVTLPKGPAVLLEEAVSKIISLIAASHKKGNKIMLIGNGGSASIASHIAIDFLKNAAVPAMAFNDASFLTCLGNDLGYERVFQKPIEMLANKGDILFAISSSGRSKNILNAAQEASKKGCFVITLSGFDKDNPLRKMGGINFYVPSHSYGNVEITHLAVCHRIVDAMMGL